MPNIPRVDLTIEQALLMDIDNIASFLQMVYADTYPNDVGITKVMFQNDLFLGRIRDILEERLANSALFYLLRIKAQIVGSISLRVDEDPSSGEIWGFYVDPTKHGQGLGRTLLKSLMNNDQVKNLKRLHLTVAKSSIRAIDFYKTDGFSIYGESEWGWPNWVEQDIKTQYWEMEKEL